MLPTRSIPRGYERSREDNDELVFSSDSEDEARGTTMTTRSSSPLTSDEGVFWLFQLKLKSVH